MLWKYVDELLDSIKKIEEAILDTEECKQICQRVAAIYEMIMRQLF